MKLSSHEYAVLSEMITMPNRKLAQKIEHLLFPVIIPEPSVVTQHETNERFMAILILNLNHSKTALDCHERWENAVALEAIEQGVRFEETSSRNVYPCAILEHPIIVTKPI